MSGLSLGLLIGLFLIDSQCLQLSDRELRNYRILKLGSHLLQKL